MENLFSIFGGGSGVGEPGFIRISVA